ARAASATSTSSGCATTASGSTPSTPTSCSASSSACTRTRNSKGRASGSPACGGSCRVTTDAAGPRAHPAKALWSTFHCRRRKRMSNCIEILIVEDDPGDALLAHEVLTELKLIERSLVLNSAEEAIEFLRSLGRYADRAPGLPNVILLDLKMPGMDGFEL